MSDENFIAYEYLAQTVPTPLRESYVDGYRNFGWQLVANREHAQNSTLKFRRDRGLAHKSELNRLQKQYDQQMAEIARLHRCQHSRPTFLALLVGIAGTAFLAGSVFAWEAVFTLLSIALAVPGFIGWALAYPLYRWSESRAERRLSPQIDAHYDNMTATCQAAFALL
ncbi:hypothetical protein [Schleiferilactobacillus shenzhenensis]|uniref:DUF2207 domain-containing protein n=1 Tax=Schleiferilactobacillus shenzhenensis LY-73 TaxID=1231336 RepID=U4TJS8_9LACO|nr:hypothetical protein [Schleiferilactobacillus shenzhenensis]ERL65091.1 hypothetical protein L248_3029 [Schleiferilactobacillus shenzhenensis LY-73]